MKVVLKTVGRFLLICLLGTGLNLSGLMFFQSLDVQAIFLASGLLAFLLWEKDQVADIRFLTAATVFLFSLILFLFLLPLKDTNWLRQTHLVLRVISFPVVYWLGCVVGYLIKNRIHAAAKKLPDINPS